MYESLASELNLQYVGGNDDGFKLEYAVRFGFWSAIGIHDVNRTERRVQTLMTSSLTL
jgi:hypothetical protein